MKKFLERLGDLLVNKRWALLAWNGGLIALLAPVVYVDWRDGQTIPLVIDVFVIGAIAGQTLQTVFASGLYRGLDSYEAAMMRADIERQMAMAWADFCKDHPEAGERMQPDLKLMQ